MNISFLSNISFSGVSNLKMAYNPIKPNFADCSSDLFQKKSSLFSVNFDKGSLELINNSEINRKKLNDLASSISNKDTKSLKFERSCYGDSGVYVLTSSNGEKTGTSLLLDNKLNVLTKEVYKLKRYANPKFGKDYIAPVYTEIETSDFRNHTSSKTIADYDSHTGHDIVISEVRIKNDIYDRPIRKEITELSDVSGVYNVRYEFPNGKTRVLSHAEIDKNTGIIRIEKDMRSSDMTRTQYHYEDDPNGNRIIDYKITDANGKVLMRKSQSFEKVSDRKFISSDDGKVYDINVSDSEINVLERNTGKNVAIKYENFIYGSKYPVISMLKNISGAELMKLSEKVSSIQGIDETLKSSCFTDLDIFSDDNLTYSKLNVSDNVFVFLHELGHAIDSGKKTAEYINATDGNVKLKIKNELSSDDEFIKIYNRERENFVKEFPQAQRKHIDYFIDDNIVSGDKSRGRKEVIAESNAILSTYKSPYMLAMRTQYLQQHFPKSIAYLNKKIFETQGG